MTEITWWSPGIFSLSTGDTLPRSSESSLAGRPKEIQGGYVRQIYDTIGKDGHVRTITSAGSSGAGAVGIDLDVARSQLWLA